MNNLENKLNNSLNKAEKFLLFFTGALIPLINLRIKVSFYSISAYMLAVVLLMFYLLIRDKIYRNNFLIFNIGQQDIIIILFILVLAFSLLYCVDKNYGIQRFIKLLIVVLFYFFYKQILIRKPNYIEIITSYAIKGLALYIIYLSYYYLFKFNVTYIGINTQYATRSEKNSLAFMMSILIAFIITDLFKIEKKRKHKFINTLFHLIVIISVLLVQSRALLLVTILQFIINFAISSKKFSLISKSIVILILIIIIINFFVPNNVIISSIDRAFTIVKVFTNNEVLNEGSIGIRLLMLQKSISLFFESPIFGVGLGSFMYYYGDIITYISHNDYLLVLAEQGIFGITLFVLLILSFLKMAYKNYRANKSSTNKGLVLAMFGVSFYFLFINAYDNILFWSLLAFISATNIENL
ncbi:MAG: O-antigen ligase family protein [Firmicutes bacterium]|nr:O-antigen ligase family protein [Bacillota bacterium]